MCIKCVLVKATRLKCNTRDQKKKQISKICPSFIIILHFFYISKPLKINSRSRSITVDISCVVYNFPSSSCLQGSTAACVGLKITEAQWLRSCCRKKQTNNQKKTTTTKNKNRKNIKEFSPVVFSAGMAGGLSVFLWIVQHPLVLSSPKPLSSINISVKIKRIKRMFC